MVLRPSRSPSNDSILLFSFGLLMLVALGVLLLAACSTHPTSRPAESTSAVGSVPVTDSESAGIETLSLGRSLHRGEPRS